MSDKGLRIVAATANTSNCYINKASEPNPPAPTPTYTITAGAGGTHELSTDGTLSITCDGALDKLTGIYVDAANYTNNEQYFWNNHYPVSHS